MFIEEKTDDRRPCLALCAPGREFVLKYLEREFNRRITDSPAESDGNGPVFVIAGVDEKLNAEQEAFIEKAREAGKHIGIVRVPHVIGTGMGDTMMRLARGVARGTMMKIKGNEARWSVVHAVDIARAAARISAVAGGDTPDEYIVSAPPVPVNDLLEALGVRIKNKRVGYISPRWAALLYGNTLYKSLTTDFMVDTGKFDSMFADFVFNNPARYLSTPLYDDESL